MAKQIQTASIDPELQKTQKVLNTQTATDGKVWQQVQVAAWMTQRDMLASIKPIWGYGKEILDSSCNQCHATPDPKHLTANAWVDGLKAMQQYYTLDKNEERVLLKYLQAHAKDAPAEAAAEQATE